MPPPPPFLTSRLWSKPTVFDRPPSNLVCTRREVVDKLESVVPRLKDADHHTLVCWVGLLVGVKRSPDIFIQPLDDAIFSLSKSQVGYVCVCSVLEDRRCGHMGGRYGRVVSLESGHLITFGHRGCWALHSKHNLCEGNVETRTTDIIKPTTSSTVRI